MKNAFRSIDIILMMASTVVTLVAGCAHAPTAKQTVAVPAPARDLDVLQVAVEAARTVGLPAVSKLDKIDGVVEFGSFQTPASDYAAQVRQRPDGQLLVTVKGGSTDTPLTVEHKAKELVTALETRLRQAPANRVTTPPVPSPSQPAPGPSAPTPSAPAPPSTPSRQPPAPPGRNEAPITVIVNVPRANLRERGDPNAKVIRAVPRSTRLTVLGRANQWYLVRLEDGTEGWVAESVTSPAR
jgi:hypothetical protein